MLDSAEESLIEAYGTPDGPDGPDEASNAAEMNSSEKDPPALTGEPISVPPAPLTRRASDYVLRNVLGVEPDVEFVPLEEQDAGSCERLLGPETLQKRSAWKRAGTAAASVAGGALVVFAVLLLLPLALYPARQCRLPAAPQPLWRSIPSSRGALQSLNGSASAALRLNDVRMLGTHNSYHVMPPVPFRWLSHEWRYTHPPLFDQLALHGVRSVELDIHQVDDALFVYHVQLFDSATRCTCLHECLADVRAWMRAAARESAQGADPVVVFFEAKSLLVEDRRAGFRGGFFAHDLVEDAIASVFEPGEILRPKDMLGGAPSLAEAIVESRGSVWPTVSDLRNKALFVMYDYFAPGTLRVNSSVILASGDTSLPRGNVAVRESREFVPGKRGYLFSAVIDGQFDAEAVPETAGFVIIDDPVRHGDAIRRAADLGFIVRTRCDDRAYLDRERTRAAVQSGAHIIATDHEAIVKDWVY